MSSFGDVRSMRPQQIWNGVVGRTVHGEQVSFSLIELDADSEVPEHAHVNEQVGILLPVDLWDHPLKDARRQLGIPSV